MGAFVHPEKAKALRGAFPLHGSKAAAGIGNGQRKDIRKPEGERDFSAAGQRMAGDIRESLLDDAEQMGFDHGGQAVAELALVIDLNTGAGGKSPCQFA